MKKNVLLVVGTFPPQEDVGGLRPAMFAKYLPSFGWRPIVLTRTFPLGDVNHKPTMTGIRGLPPEDDIVNVEIATGSEGVGPKGLLDKAVKFFKPEYGRSWALIEKMTANFLASHHAENIDVIYTTSPDFSEVVVGLKIAKTLDVPLIVDFRDIAEQDEHLGFQRRLLYYRHIARRYWVTRNSFRIIVVSAEHKKILSKKLRAPVNLIVNGYDHEMFVATEGLHSKIFNINYFGRIFGKWLRDPTVFFGALDLLLEDTEVDSDKLQVNFYGTEEEILVSIAEPYKCKKLLRINPRVEYEKVPELISNSSVNLVLTNEGRVGVLTTKFFEYLAVKRPILCVPNDKGALNNIINKTKSGLISSDSLEVYEYIRILYKNWKENFGELKPVDSCEVENYSRKHLTSVLAQILDQSTKNTCVENPSRCFC